MVTTYSKFLTNYDTPVSYDETKKDLNRKKYLRNFVAKAARYIAGEESSYVDDHLDPHWRQESARSKEKVWTKEERAAYFRALERQKDYRHRLKKLRQKARKMDDSVITEGFADKFNDSFGVFLDKATKVLQGIGSENDDNILHGHRVRFQNAIKYGRLPVDDASGLFDSLSNLFGDSPKTPAILHCMLLAVALFMSDDIYMDIVLIGLHLSAVGLMKDASVILAALLPSLLLMRTGYRWLNKKNESLPEVESDEVKTEGEGTRVSDFLYNSRKNVAEFITSHFMMAIREIVLVLAHYHLFPKKVALQLSLWLGKVEKPKSIPEAISRITTDVAHLVKMSEAYADGKPLSDILLAADPTKEAKKKYDELIYQSSQLYFGLPSKDKYDGRTWVMEARKLVEVLRSMQKNLNPYHSHTEVLNSRMKTLLEKVALLESKCYRSKRPTPFFIVIVSPPGVGKSSITTYVYQLWSYVMGRDFDQSHVYERVTSSDYWDCYDPLSMPIIHYSEIGSLTEQLARMGQDKAIMELLSVIDSQPYCLNMSAVEDKNRIYCMPELVVIDTNNAGLNLKCIFQNSAAYERRALYMRPVVKQAFRLGPGKPGLDPTIPSDDFMDKWTFDMWRKVPIDASRSETVTIMDSTNPDHDIFALTDVLSNMMKNHVEREAAIVKKSEENWVKKSISKVSALNNLRKEWDPDYIGGPNPMFDGKGEVGSYGDESIPFLIPRKRSEDDEETISGDLLDFESDELKDDFSDDDDECYLIPPGEDLSWMDNDATEEEYTEGVKEFKSRWGQFADRMLATSNAYMLNPYTSLRDLFKKKHVLTMPDVESDSFDAKLERVRSKWKDMMSKYRFSKPHMDILAGKVHDHVQVNEFCECCPLGVHRYNRFERFRTLAKDVSLKTGSLMFTFMRLFLQLCVMGPTLFAVSALTTRLWILVFSALAFLAPGGLVVGLSMILVHAIARVIAWTVDIDLVKLFGTQVLSRTYKRFSIQCERVWDYCKGNKQYVIAGTVGTLALIYIIPKIAKLFAKMLPNVESTFVSKSEVSEKILEVEKQNGMCPPSKKISSKLPAKMYGDNVMSLPNPRCHIKDGETLRLLAMRNLRPAMFVTYYEDDTTFTSKALIFGVKGRYGIFSLHQLDLKNGIRFEIHYAQSPAHKCFDDSYAYAATDSYNSFEIGLVSSDIGIARISGTQFRDVLKFVPESNVPVKNMQVDVAGDLSRANDMGNIRCNNNALETETIQENAIKYSMPEHRPGICGLPVLGELISGWWILAIHSAGHRGKDAAYGMKITRDKIQETIDVLDEIYDFKINSSPETESLAVTDVESRSWCHYIDQNNVTIYGKCHAFNGNQKTSLIKSIFSKDKDFYMNYENLFLYPREVQWEPAVLRPTKKGSPITLGAIKLTTVKGDARHDILQHCGDVAFAKIIENLTKLDVVRDFAPYDVDTAVNGHENDEFARRIDMSKGAGFGYSGDKRDHFILVDPVNHKYEPGPELMRDLVSIYDAYEDDLSVNPIFKASLKEELRPREKVLAHKTRVFYGGPLPFLIVHKQLMGPLYTLMVRHSDAFYAALGIDMHRDGHRIREKFTRFSVKKNSQVNIGAGDYGGFDTSMPYSIGEEAARLSYRLLEWLGYNEKQLKLLRGCLTDLLFPRVDYFGDLCLVPGLQPSGKYGTAEDNSLRNLLILMYAWYNKPALQEKDFFEHVLPVLYGDDVLYCVTDDVADEYNDLWLQESCKSIGLEYTSSKKGEVEMPFVDHSEVDFLKRRDRYHPDLKRNVSALHMDSIVKSLEWISPSRKEHVNIERQYQSICNSALLEFFFHSQRREYEKLRDFLHRVLVENFPDAEFAFPQYDELVAKYEYNEEIEELWRNRIDFF